MEGKHPLRRQNKEKLATLAQFFLVLNKDRLEVCYMLVRIYENCDVR
jgi:hypothetical protein